MNFIYFTALILVSATLITPTMGHTQEAAVSQNQLHTQENIRIKSLQSLLEATVNDLNGKMNRIITCNEKSMAYAPNSPAADADGCISVGSVSLSSYQSKSFNTTHTASKTSFVSVYCNNAYNAGTFMAYVDGNLVATDQDFSPWSLDGSNALSFMVPKGSTYKVDITRGTCGSKDILVAEFN
jgi:hypothetical protein